MIGVRQNSFRENLSWSMALVLASVLGISVAGCSTPQAVQNHRVGLIDSFRKVSVAPPKQVRAPSSEAVLTSEVRKKVSSFQWPLQEIHVTSPFGPRGAEFHEGVDLRAPDGTVVVAAQKGIVIYAGRKISGYGNMVVIRHASGVATIYAHNSRLLVRRGQKVRQGQRIALSGHSGRVRGPHLHFEVRNGLAALNPSEALPQFVAKKISTPARKVASKQN